MISLHITEVSYLGHTVTTEQTPSTDEDRKQNDMVEKS